MPAAPPLPFHPAHGPSSLPVCALSPYPLALSHPQAKEALTHPYFSDLDKVTVDALESEEVRQRIAAAAAANAS